VAIGAVVVIGLMAAAIAYQLRRFRQMVAGRH
jgi:hypothetical protein